MCLVFLQIIAIHDGARPFVSLELIEKTLDAALEYGASVPACQPVDTQKEIDETGSIVRHLRRSSLAAVQTPQCFAYEKMLDLDSERVQKISEQITGYMLGLSDEQLKDAKGPKE